MSLNQVLQTRREQVLAIHDMLKKLTVLRSGVAIDEKKNNELWSSAQKWEEKIFLKFGHQLSSEYYRAVDSQLQTLKQAHRKMLDKMNVGGPPPIKPVGVGGPPPISGGSSYDQPKSTGMSHYAARSKAHTRAPPTQGQRQGNRIPQYRAPQAQRPVRGGGLQPARTNFEPQPVNYRRQPAPLQRSKPEPGYPSQQGDRAYRYADPHLADRRVKTGYPMPNVNVEPIVSGHGNRGSDNRFIKNQYQHARPPAAGVQVQDEREKYFNVIAQLKKKFFPLLNDWEARTKRLVESSIGDKKVRAQHVYKGVRALREHLTNERMHPDGIKFIKEKLIPRLESVRRLYTMQKEKSEASRRQQAQSASQSQMNHRLAQQRVQRDGAYAQHTGYNQQQSHYPQQVAPVPVPAPKRKRAESVETKRSKPAAQTKRQRKQPKPAEVIVINEDSDAEVVKPKPKPKPKPRQRKEPKKRATKRGKKVAQSKATPAPAPATGSVPATATLKETAKGTNAKAKTTAAPAKDKTAVVNPAVTSSVQALEPKPKIETNVAAIPPRAGSELDMLADTKEKKLDQSMQYDSPSSTISVAGTGTVTELEEKSSMANPINLDPLTPSTPFSPPITGTIATDNSFISYLDDGPKVDWDPVSAACQEIALM